MIVYSMEKLLPTVSNVMTLEKEGYFYVFKDTYDECVILSNRYTQEDMLEKLGIDTTNMEAYNLLVDKLPKPINILAGFILLVEDKIDAEVEQLCGALSEITSYMSLVKYVTSNPEVRKSVSYTRYILEEYQMSWKKFLTMAIKFEQIDELLKPAELHPKQEQVPYMPVYMMPGNPAMLSNNTVQQVEQKVENIEDQIECNGNEIIFDDDIDSGIDLSSLLPKKPGENIEEVRDTDNKEGTESVNQSDVAGFNSHEDEQKALDLLNKKPKLSAK